MIRYAFIPLLLVISLTLPGQNTYTLEQCWQMASDHYPLKQQTTLAADASALKISNLNKNFLPQINMNGSATVQSDVTEVNIELPKGLPELSMPTISKDWYKLTLDVNQAIYDGRVTNYQKQVENFTLQADQKNIEVELYKLRERVNQFYFSILLIDQQEKLLISNAERIRSKIIEVKSAIEQGSMMEMNGDILKAELIRVEQQMTEVAHDRATLCKMLSELTGTAISADASFIVPEVQVFPESYRNLRLENQLFDLQKSRLEVMKNMVTTKWNPKVYAFGQAGYGRPGLNMLDNNFKPWGIIGAKVTWNPWNWNINKNEKQILAIQSEIVRSNQETFDKNLRINAEKELGEMNKIAGLLEQDRQIIDLRSKIARAASSQLDNGVITSSDYIARLNEETQAKLNHEIHQLQLVRAKVAYLYTLGENLSKK